MKQACHWHLDNISANAKLKDVLTQNQMHSCFMMVAAVYAMGCMKVSCDEPACLTLPVRSILSPTVRPDVSSYTCACASVDQTMPCWHYTRRLLQHRSFPRERLLGFKVSPRMVRSRKAAFLMGAT